MAMGIRFRPFFGMLRQARQAGQQQEGDCDYAFFMSHLFYDVICSTGIEPAFQLFHFFPADIKRDLSVTANDDYFMPFQVKFRYLVAVDDAVPSDILKMSG